MSALPPEHSKPYREGGHFPARLRLAAREAKAIEGYGASGDDTIAGQR